jgi:hypothetical protein
METYLSTRPTSFPSLASGIEWHTRTRTIRNHTSARVSVPSLLIQQDSSTTNSSSQQQWTWRTDLSATKPFWENWFVGLSKKFLEARGGKLLLLAGTDRLDKELMIGQMQGLSHKGFFLSFFHPHLILFHSSAGCPFPSSTANRMGILNFDPEQENTSLPSSLTPATLCTKTSPPRLRRSSPTFTGGTTAVRSCYRPRWAIC